MYLYVNKTLVAISCVAMQHPAKRLKSDSKSAEGNLVGVRPPPGTNLSPLFSIPSNLAESLGCTTRGTLFRVSHARYFPKTSENLQAHEKGQQASFMRLSYRGRGDNTRRAHP
jgi:hypothetical protein